MAFNLNQLLEKIAQIAPNPYIQAGLIIILFAVLAKLVDIFITRFMRRLLTKTRITFDDQILEIFHKPIFVSIVLFGLALATDRLGFSLNVYFVTLSGLKTVAIFLWSMAAARFMKLIVKVVSRDESRFTLIQDRTLPLFNNLLVILVVALAIYFICLTWKIDMTAWIASAGIIGLAVSFAAKDSLANLFSGVFILADAPYKLGDFIVLDSGERGQVTHIGIRSTRLLTRDDVEITVPNAIMGNAKITNEAGGPQENFRIRIKVGVAYGSDIDKVHAVLLDVAEKQPEVCKSPAPRVRFRAFGESSLDHELLCWVERPVLKGSVTHLLNTSVFKRFRAEGIEIPFPQRDVNIKSTSSASKIGDVR
jgi:MscS family membrane protein